jgi:von Willebrand factor type A domain
MNFLQSGLWPALAPLVALPFVIHLLNRRLPLKIMFPDIERIVRSLAGRSRVATWRHLLMMLIRTLAVLLILIAFLKPVLPRLGSELSGRHESGGRRVLLIADRSLSMEHHGGTQASAAQRLLIEASKILATLTRNDTVNAILAAHQPEALLPAFSSAPEQVQTGLAALPPSMEKSDPAKALALAATLLGEAPAGSEVYILSDFQRSGWADTTFESIPEGVRLFFVDTSSGDRSRPNTALLRVTPSATTVSAREPVRLDITAANYSPAPLTLPLEAIIDGRLATPGEVRIEPWSTARTTLQIAAPGEGIHQVEVRTPDDALPADNHRWLRLEVREREEVIVLCDDTTDDSGARFVMAALDPYEGKSGPFTVSLLKSADLTPARLGSASRLVLTGSARLPESLLQRLIAFTEQGGGVLWFLDGAHDSANLTTLNQLAGGSLIPFQLAGKLTTENFGGTPQKMAKGKFDSRFLRLFRTTGRQSLGLLEFYATQRALPTGHGSVLLSYADGMPALGSANTGLGAIVFCNFAPSELASNIARQRLFPAWMQDLVKALKPDSTPDTSHETGATIHADVWLDDFRTASVRAPDQSEVTVKSTIESGRLAFSFPARRAGVYTLGPPARLLWAAAVNVPESEADLRSIDPDEIRRRSVTGAGRAGEFVSNAADYTEITTGRPVFHWYLLAAVGLISVEMLLFRPFLRAAGHSPA